MYISTYVHMEPNVYMYITIYVQIYICTYGYDKYLGGVFIIEQSI